MTPDLGTLLQATGLGLTAGSGLVALIIPLLLVVPGVVGFKVGVWTARRNNPFTRLETLVYSFGVSIASLVFLYATTSVLNWKYMKIQHMVSADFPEIALLYLAHILISVAVGAGYGSFTYNYILESRYRDQYDSWDFAFEYTPQDKPVYVKTTGGDWFEGHVVQYGRSAGTRDILLASPKALDIEDEGNHSQRDLNETLPDQSTDGPQPEADNDLAEIEPGEDDNTSDDIDELLDKNDRYRARIQERDQKPPLGKFLYVNEPDIENVIFNEDSVVEPQEELRDRDRVHRRCWELYKELRLGRVFEKARMETISSQTLLVAPTFFAFVGILYSFSRIAAEPTVSQPLGWLCFSLVGVVVGVGTRTSYQSLFAVDRVSLTTELLLTLAVGVGFAFWTGMVLPSQISHQLVMRGTFVTLISSVAAFPLLSFLRYSEQEYTTQATGYVTLGAHPDKSSLGFERSSQSVITA